MAPKTRTAGPLFARTGDLGIILILLVPLLLATSPTVNAQTRTGSLALNPGEDLLMSAVIDAANGFAYFGTDTSPGIVVKVRLSDFTRVGALTLNPGEGPLRSAVIDAANGFAYFGTDTSPGIVVKVRLSDFTRVGALNTGERHFKSAVIDSVAGFAYFASTISPGTIVKVRLSDFTRVGALTLNTGENALYSAVIDATNGYAYFGTYTDPGRVVKVRLSDFTRVGALTLGTGEDRLLSAVIDSANGWAFFGTGTVPGIVVKVRLADFTRLGALTLSTGEDTLESAVIDPANGFAYFGTATSPGLVVKVGLNSPPVLSAIGPKTVDELTPLAFLVQSSEYDPGQTVAFSLSGAPEGATINPVTGDFTWTPTEVQGPGSFQVTIVVTDNGTPALSASETITITVREVNIKPTLTVPPAQTLDEETPLTFTVSATDPDIPTNTITLSADGLPAGASFNAATGQFSWTPSEAQGPGGFTITFTATDNGTPTLSDTKSVTVTVNEVNKPPVLTVPGSRNVDVDSLLTFTVTATDADIPQNTLTFSLGQGAPSGASVSGNGIFSWRPTTAQTGDFSVTILVSDGTVSTTQIITITVGSPRVAPAPAPWWQQYWYLILFVGAGLAVSAVLVARKLQGEEGKAQSA